MNRKQIEKNITDLQNRIEDLRLMDQTKEVKKLIQKKQKLLSEYEIKLTNKLKQLNQ